MEFKDPRNAELRGLMGRLNPEIWTLSVLSGAVGCMSFCGEYRSAEGLMFSCKDTQALLSVATLWERNRLYDAARPADMARPATLSRFKTGIFPVSERFGMLKVLWFREVALRGALGDEIFEAQGTNGSSLTPEGLLGQRFYAFDTRDWSDPFSNVAVDLLALFDLLGPKRFGAVCDRWRAYENDDVFDIQDMDVRALAERSLDRFCLPGWSDRLAPFIGPMFAAMRIPCCDRAREKPHEEVAL